MNPIPCFFRRAVFMTRIIRARAVGKSRPLTLGLAVTSRCNLSCSICFGRYYQKKIPDLPLEVVLNLIDHLARRGTAFINFTGGEPLMRRDIGEIFRRSRERGILTAVTTNGTLIERYLDDLAQLDFVCVSMDGDRESHDRMRGTGTHELIMNNIKLLQRRGVPVQVTCLLNRYNVRNLRWIFEAGRQEGFTVKILMPTDETEFAPNNPDVALTDSEMRSALQSVVKWQQEGFPVDFSSSTYKYALRWHRSLWEPKAFRGESFPAPPWPCYYGRYACHIDPDGKIYPCCNVIGNFKALDFREVGFDRAFAHTATRSCVTCVKIPCNEFNQLIDLRLRVIVKNAWRSLRALFQGSD